VPRRMTPGGFHIDKGHRAIEQRFRHRASLAAVLHYPRHERTRAAPKQCAFGVRMPRQTQKKPFEAVAWHLL
jgi:hypothetical protein